MSREMKDSGVEWIGEIPKDWEVARVKNAFIRKNEKAQQENPTILSLARSGVKVRDISTGEGQIAESYYNYNPVEIGDLLLNPMDLYSGANCSISKVSGVISPAYINLKAKNGYNSVYYDYYFKTQYWSMALFAHGKGVSYDNRWTLNVETLFNYYIPLPKYHEQEKIANFLDEKVGEIDRLIDNAKKSIEEYKKYKQSVITEAVTKGLDPNVEMKDSGIEWIGNIPKDWKIIKMNRLIVSTQNGLSRRNLNNSIGKIVLKLSNMTIKGTIDYSCVNRIDLSDKEIESYGLQEGDFLFVRVNGSKSLVGKCAIYRDIGEPVAFNDHIIRVKINRFCNKKYFLWYLLSNSGKKEIDTHITTAAGQFTINGNSLRNLNISLPPIKEQEKIINYLDSKCIEIDNLISKKEKLILELETYKKSLIYEYVTGKKEVL